MICNYCSQEICGCGANEMAEPVKEKLEYGFYQFYNGYIVWSICNIMYDTVTFYFYLGRNLVDIIQIGRHLLEERLEIGQSEMPFVWQLFELSQGNKDIYIEIPPESEYKITYEYINQKPDGCAQPLNSSRVNRALAELVMQKG